MNFKEKLYRIIEPSIKFNTKKNREYDIFISIVVLVSFVPLFFKDINILFWIIEIVCAGIYVVDYILHWVTAELSVKKGKKSYLLYPIMPWAIIDLLSIIPVFGLINPAFVMLRLFRLLRVFSFFKWIRYSRHFKMLINVFYRNRYILVGLCVVIFSYIIITALIMFNVEQNIFDNYLDALYWSTVTLATIGYGDFVPLTTAGKVITIVSSFFGCFVIAVPAGVIAAGFMNQIKPHCKPQK